MNTIVEVQPEPEYKVWLRFEDGVEGEADLSVLVGRGVLKAWEEPERFSKSSSTLRLIRLPGPVE